jgi:hypothetical protein
MNGLYILDGEAICTGEKTAIAAPDERGIAGPRLLIIKTDSGGQAIGTVILAEAKTVDVQTFDSMQDKHGVSSKDRMRWWPGKRTLYVYSVIGYEDLLVPMPIDIPPGVGMKMDISMDSAVVLDCCEQDKKQVHTVCLI